MRHAIKPTGKWVADLASIRETFGINLKAILAHRGLTQKEFAERLGVHFTMVNKWVSGKALPSARSIDSIAAALEIQPYELFSGPDTKRHAEAELIKAAKRFLTQNGVKISEIED